MPLTPSTALETVVAIVQTAFYAVVATVTILTYMHARRTLFQPVRTEIFKEQLKELSQVLAPFVGKSEADLRNFFALELALCGLGYS